MSQAESRPELFFELGLAAELTLRALGLEADGDDKTHDDVWSDTRPTRPY
jgi:hypothetical protein